MNMRRYLDFYSRKPIEELAAKYVLFENDTETGHTDAMGAIWVSMLSRNHPVSVHTHLERARDVYRMLVPEIEGKSA